MGGKLAEFVGNFTELRASRRKRYRAPEGRTSNRNGKGVVQVSRQTERLKRSLEKERLELEEDRSSRLEEEKAQLEEALALRK